MAACTVGERLSKRSDCHRRRKPKKNNFIEIKRFECCVARKQFEYRRHLFIQPSPFFHYVRSAFIIYRKTWTRTIEMSSLPREPKTLCVKSAQTDTPHIYSFSINAGAESVTKQKWNIISCYRLEKLFSSDIINHKLFVRTPCWWGERTNEKKIQKRLLRKYVRIKGSNCRMTVYGKINSFLFVTETELHRNLSIVRARSLPQKW